jgi:CBS domain containing-hemolysin-like protein
VGRARARAFDSPYVLLLSANEEPLGWVSIDTHSSNEPLTAERVDGSSPLVHLETTLRDTLSMLLASAVQTAVVVDDRGRYQGMLTLDTVSLAFRADDGVVPAAETVSA